MLSAELTVIFWILGKSSIPEGTSLSSFTRAMSFFHMSETHSKLDWDELWRDVRSDVSVWQYQSQKNRYSFWTWACGYGLQCQPSYRHLHIVSFRRRCIRCNASQVQVPYKGLIIPVFRNVISYQFLRGIHSAVLCIVILSRPVFTLYWSCNLANPQTVCLWSCRSDLMLIFVLHFRLTSNTCASGAEWLIDWVHRTFDSGLSHNDNT